MKERPSKLKLEDLTTSNPAMARCLQLAALAAKSDVPVVLLGETGTGKTLLAHAIAHSSPLTPRQLAIHSSKVSCLVTSAGHSLARSKTSRENSSSLMAVRYSWTKSRR